MLPISQSDTQKQTVTTIQLRNLINEARESMGEKAVQNSQFIKRVEDELESEIEGQKYIDLAPRTKTPMSAYRLTMQQAMLVGMRESKAVRRAVLAKLESMQQPPAPVAPVTPMQKAVSDMEAWKALAGVLEVPIPAMLLEGAKHVAITHDIDLGPALLKSPLMDDIQPEDEMLEPTEIGRIIGMTAREVNSALASAGYQYRQNGQWLPTQKSAGHTIKHMWSAGSKSGYNLKWRVQFVRDALGL